MTEIALSTARIIAEGALEHARKSGFKPMAVAIVDAGGRLIAFNRDDGAAPGRFELALAKASGCVMLGVSGRALAALNASNPGVVTAAGAAFGGKLFPAAGGVLLMDGNGAVIGGVGVSGDAPDNDEKAAVAGIERAGLAYQA
ncbi:GlcG/HbpS family heme-binding protein [Martelella soudanensis]|uniref:GlcG/HbpS family heme-binding protein n=1 Tax=unclassified Martelella TaxID=2629616 RepID=UPI0015E020BD|nr:MULTISPECIES: heme-binding protein [unclassified Martelella]